MMGREITGSQKVVGDDNFSHEFYVGEFTGMSFDDLRGYTEKRAGGGAQGGRCAGREIA